MSWIDVYEEQIINLQSEVKTLKDILKEKLTPEEKTYYKIFYGIDIDE